MWLDLQDHVAVSEAGEAMERNIHNEQNIDRPLRGARVLVVEDDALVLMELESILQDAGAETVACCRNVNDGLRDWGQATGRSFRSRVCKTMFRRSEI